MSYFRRRTYHQPGQHQDVKPKWHVLAERDGNTITAKCGYTFAFLLESPMIKPMIATESMRCLKCQATANKPLPDKPPF